MSRFRCYALLTIPLLICVACMDSTAPPTVISPASSPSMGRFTVTGFALKSAGAGFFHTCGLTTAGKAYCWGDNTFGELGDGTNNPSNVPVPVGGNLTFSAIALGSFHTCGLSNGKAFCWGLNANADFTDSNTPVEVPGGLTFSSITAGGGEGPQHTCAVTKDGVAYCWGDNFAGQLGDGTDSPSSTPVGVAGGFTFASVSAGGFHTCGLTRAGQALCWGDNTIGELGNGSPDATRTSPGAVSTAQLFTSISAGVYHTCGLSRGGQALCWGRNQFAQLGVGDTTAYNYPVTAASGMTFVSLGVGVGHTCGIVKGGKAYCWGLNETRQLGAGSSEDMSGTPLAVTGGFTFTSLALGGLRSCAITKDLGTWCWGANNAGQLGLGTTGDPVVAPSPVSKP